MRSLTIAGLLLLTAAWNAGTVNACPFCSAPSLTLTEQVEQSDVAILVAWTSARKASPRTIKDDKAADGVAATRTVTDPASTTFVTVDTLRGGADRWKKGTEIAIARYRDGKAGELFLLLGTNAPVGDDVEWGIPLSMSQGTYKYIQNAPSSKIPTAKRLRYFVDYLEFPDELVANDAYGEFANAPYEDIKTLSDVLPRERILSWVENPDTVITRLGLYGLLIGLCGNEKDEAVIREKIVSPTNTFRLGIDGVMSGYLLLAGEDGLKVIEETKLVPEKGKVPFSETYAAMQALRFMWTYGEGEIKKERLKQSMRLLLDRSELSDLVIADLARWKDWSIRDRLMKLYGAEGYEVPAIKRAIVRFMLVCANDKTKTEDDKTPEHVTDAEAYLKKLREDDPVTVRQAEKYFVLK